MTLDEFETRLVDMRDDIVNLTPILTEIGNEMTRELQSAAPTGKTGNLQSSIRLDVQPQQFAVTMLAYGVFQNYGVVGVDGGDRAKKPRGGQVSPDSIFPAGSGEGGKYQFGVKQPKYRGWGAYYTGFNKNIGWFDVEDLTQQVTTRLQQRINQAFQ